MNEQNGRPYRRLTVENRFEPLTVENRFEHRSVPLGIWQAPDQTARVVEQLAGEAANHWVRSLAPAFAVLVHTKLAARLKQAATEGLGDRRAAVIASRMEGVLQDVLRMDWAPITFTVSLSDTNEMTLTGTFAASTLRIDYQAQQAPAATAPAGVSELPGGDQINGF